MNCAWQVPVPNMVQHAVMQRAFSNVFIGRPVFIAMRGFLVMQMYKKSIEQYVPFAEAYTSAGPTVCGSPDCVIFAVEWKTE